MSRKGRMMPDEEIFDFTDSRFLQPPEVIIFFHRKQTYLILFSDTSKTVSLF